MPSFVFLSMPPAVCLNGERLLTNRRSRNPNPTPAVVGSLIRDSFQRIGREARFSQIDLRDEHWGELKRTEYGKVKVPYLKEPLIKTYDSVQLPSPGVRAEIERSDILLFSGNFTANRNILKMHIAEARRMNPKAEIWLGGSDASTIIDLGSWLVRPDVLFTGETIFTLPSYIQMRWGAGKWEGLKIKRNGDVVVIAAKPSNTFEIKGLSFPLPLYEARPGFLERFSESSEGPFPQGIGVPAAYFYTSLGCPMDCDFCTAPELRRYFWSMNLEEIEKQLAHLKSIGINTLLISDDQVLGGLLLHPGMGGIDCQLNRIRSIMALINKYGFDIEFSNGLQMSLLLKYWNELAESLFENCFRLYVPLERLSRTKELAKLPSLEDTMELLRRLAALPALGTVKLRQLTLGLVFGSPGDAEEDLKSTVARCEEVKRVFKGSEIEIAVTPFCCNIVPGAEMFRDHGGLNLFSVEEHPELLSYSLVSNHTASLHANIVWDYWLAAMNTNPAPGYLENFRKTGGVTFARVT